MLSSPGTVQNLPNTAAAGRPNVLQTEMSGPEQSAEIFAPRTGLWRRRKISERRPRIHYHWWPTDLHIPSVPSSDYAEGDVLFRTSAPVTGAGNAPPEKASVSSQYYAELGSARCGYSELSTPEPSDTRTSTASDQGQIEVPIGSSGPYYSEAGILTPRRRCYPRRAARRKVQCTRETAVKKTQRSNSTDKTATFRQLCCLTLCVFH
jgi:hypothetical protein